MSSSRTPVAAQHRGGGGEGEADAVPGAGGAEDAASSSGWESGGGGGLGVMEHPEEPMLAGEARSASEEVAAKGVRGPPRSSWQQPAAAARGGEQPPGARLGYAHPITTCFHH